MKKIYIDLNSPQYNIKSPPRITPVLDHNQHNHPRSPQQQANAQHQHHNFAKLLINTNHLLKNTSTIHNHQNIQSQIIGNLSFFEHINKYQTVHIMNQMNNSKPIFNKLINNRPLFDVNYHGMEEKEVKQMTSDHSKESSQYINYLKQYNSLKKSHSRQKSISPLKQKQQMSLLIKQFLQDIDQNESIPSQKTPVSIKKLHNQTSYKKQYHTPNQQTVKLNINLTDPQNFTQNTNRPKHQQIVIKTAQKLQSNNKSTVVSNNKNYQQKQTKLLNKQEKQALSPQKSQQYSTKNKYIQLHLKKKEGRPQIESNMKKQVKMVEAAKQIPKKSIEIMIDIDQSMLSGVSKKPITVQNNNSGDQTQKQQLISEIKWKVKELLNKQIIIKR